MARGRKPQADSKAARALQIAQAHPNATPAQLVEMFVAQLQMTMLGARTYAYNVRKQLGAPSAPKTEAVKKTAAPSTPHDPPFNNNPAPLPAHMVVKDPVTRPIRIIRPSQVESPLLDAAAIDAMEDLPSFLDRRGNGPDA